MPVFFGSTQKLCPLCLVYGLPGGIWLVSAENRIVQDLPGEALGWSSQCSSSPSVALAGQRAQCPRGARYCCWVRSRFLGGGLWPWVFLHSMLGSNDPFGGMGKSMGGGGQMHRVLYSRDPYMPPQGCCMLLLVESVSGMGRGGEGCGQCPRDSRTPQRSQRPSRHNLPVDQN